MRFRRPGPALLTVVVANVLAAVLLIAAVFLSHGESPEATQRGSASGSATSGEGLDRYAAAVARSRASFPSGPVRVVFVVTGEGPGDAVTAGPLGAALGGPVLALPKTGIPPTVRGELRRLQPKRIVMLGGTSAISDATAERLRDFTTGSVTRLAGADRYATAALAATTVFTAPVPQVLIMTDAAHADPEADLIEVSATRPVLLATASGLPPETAAALRRLRPRSIAVSGNASVVSDTVVRQLQRYTAGPVTRLPGRPSTRSG